MKNAPNSKIAAAVNAFWAANGELRACDVPRTVAAESAVVVHGRRVHSLIMTGELPKRLANGEPDLSSIARGLPPNWTADTSHHSDLVGNVTHTRNALRITIDAARAGAHPLATEGVYIIALTLAVFFLLVTLAYRYIYIY